MKFKILFTNNEKRLDDILLRNLVKTKQNNEMEKLHKAIIELMNAISTFENHEHTQK